LISIVILIFIFVIIWSHLISDQIKSFFSIFDRSLHQYWSQLPNFFPIVTIHPFIKIIYSRMWSIQCRIYWNLDLDWDLNVNLTRDLDLDLDIDI
jgi:hypothetical protein